MNSHRNYLCMSVHSLIALITVFWNAKLSKIAKYCLTTSHHRVYTAAHKDKKWNGIWFLRFAHYLSVHDKTVGTHVNNMYNHTCTFNKYIALSEECHSKKTKLIILHVFVNSASHILTWRGFRNGVLRIGGKSKTNWTFIPSAWKLLSKRKWNMTISFSLFV